MQILLGPSCVGQYIALIPYSVISGFMNGIGAIIIILQAGLLVAHAAHSEGVLATLAMIPSFFADPVVDAWVLGVVSLMILIGVARATTLGSD